MQNNSYIRVANLQDLEIINDLLYLSKSFWGYDANFMNKFMHEHSVTINYLKLNLVYLYFVQNKLVAFYSFSLNDNNFELEYFLSTLII